MGGQSSPTLTPKLVRIYLFWLDVQRQKQVSTKHIHTVGEKICFSFYFSLNRGRKSTHRNISIEHTLGNGWTFSRPKTFISYLDNCNSCPTGFHSDHQNSFSKKPPKQISSLSKISNDFQLFLESNPTPLSRPTRSCMTWFHVCFCNLTLKYSCSLWNRYIDILFLEHTELVPAQACCTCYSSVWSTLFWVF